MSKISGVISAVCISEKKGTKKHPVESALLKTEYGIVNDAHAGNWHRQISLLDREKVLENIDLFPDIKPGDFGENILVSGVMIHRFEIGTEVKIGNVLLKITQIGKECHNDCEIKRLTGKCIMPKYGVFARVLKGGKIKPGDVIEIL